MTIGDADIALPVQLHPLADLAAVAIVRVLGGADAVTIGQTQSLVETAHHQMRGAAALILQNLDAREGGRWKRGEGYIVVGIACDYGVVVDILTHQSTIVI